MSIMQVNHVLYNWFYFSCWHFLTVVPISADVVKPVMAKKNNIHSTVYLIISIEYEIWITLSTDHINASSVNVFTN